ncbi:zinc finger CCCH domain-containing protein 39-like [Sesamum indicum]|uniref:Zinc finger CCCH domain-containing protein 39-like n=1 Tax=Sesamum indicum TaxID=4182 RepID=A0A6I9SQ81_SESIN|nr:zinc finger CCCH domain-containing protein 39-like [Sesamum indicum]
MSMNHFNDTQVSNPADFGGKNTFDNCPQPRIANHQSSSIHSNFDFKKPRFSERNPNPRIPLSVNRSKLSVPYKSELCLLFQRGKCYYGANCHFSHSISDIRNPGLNTLAMEGHLNEDSKRNTVRKMKECHWFASGKDCPYGDKCQYLHKCDQKVRRDVGFYRQSSAVNGGKDRSGNDQIECHSFSAGEDYDKSVFCKTKLCMKWERFGSCPYGVKCTYAHGKAELQELGSLTELENSYTSRLKLPNSAASCEMGRKIAKKLQGKRCFMDGDIKKISEVYADWMEDRQNFHIPSSKIGS